MTRTPTQYRQISAAIALSAALATALPSSAAESTDDRSASDEVYAVAPELRCDVLALAAGGNHTLALKADGSVRAWGEGTYGQLGNNSKFSASDEPVIVSPLSDVIAVAAGALHSLALKSDGTVQSWGYNLNGQLGLGTASIFGCSFATKPQLVPNLSDVIAIAGGGEHSLAVTVDGRVWAWGRNDAGQLGIDPAVTTASSTPLLVPGITDVVAVAAGLTHSVALRADGTVWTWGYNAVLQLGRATALASLDFVPVAVPTLADVKAIAASGAGNHSLALRADGRLFAWGWAENGQLGDNPSTNLGGRLPLQVGEATDFRDVKAIAAGGRHSLALRADGTVWAWGFNVNGQLGAVEAPPQEQSSVPMQVLLVSSAPGELREVSLIAAGAMHSVAYQAGGELFAWGQDHRGQLGDKQVTATTQVQTHVNKTQLVCGDCIKTLTAVAGGGGHTLALVADATVAAFGDNAWGQLGNGDATLLRSSRALSVPGIGTAVAVAAGTAHSLALLSDGTVRAWGSNRDGELGIRSATPISSVNPLTVLDAVSGLAFDRVIAVAAGDHHSLLLRSDGTIWGFGRNDRGQLGDGTTASSLAPVQVVDVAMGAVLARAIASGGNHSLAIAPGGAALAWGRNDLGQLGNADPLLFDAPNPVAVVRSLVALDLVAALASRLDHSLARRASGEGWAWGSNGNGELSQPASPFSAFALPLSAPVTNGVRAVGAGGGHSLAVTGTGAAWSWGLNDQGQLGDNTVMGGPMPRAVKGLFALGSLDRVSVLALGVRHSLAIRSNGDLLGWGRNSEGQLGLQDFLDRAVPTQMPEVPDVVPSDQGNVLMAVKDVSVPVPVDVILDWRGVLTLPLPAIPAAKWTVYRYFSVDPMTPEIGKLYLENTGSPWPINPQQISITNFVDFGAVPVPITALTLYFYRVRGLSRCYFHPGL